MSGGFEGRLSTLWGGAGSVPVAADAFVDAAAVDSAPAACGGNRLLRDKGFDRKLRWRCEACM